MTTDPRVHFMNTIADYADMMHKEVPTVRSIAVPVTPTNVQDITETACKLLDDLAINSDVHLLVTMKEPLD